MEQEEVFEAAEIWRYAMVSVRKNARSHDRAGGQGRPLPLRWGVIFGGAAVAAAPAGAVMGLPGAIGVFFVVAGAAHAMLE